MGTYSSSTCQQPPCLVESTSSQALVDDPFEPIPVVFDHQVAPQAVNSSMITSKQTAEASYSNQSLLALMEEGSDLSQSDDCCSEITEDSWMALEPEPIETMMSGGPSSNSATLFGGVIPQAIDLDLRHTDLDQFLEDLY